MTALKEYRRVVGAVQITDSDFDAVCVELNKDRTDASAWHFERQGDYLVVVSADWTFPPKLGRFSGDDPAMSRGLNCVNWVRAGLGDWVVDNRDGTVAFLSDEVFCAEFKELQ